MKKSGKNCKNYSKTFGFYIFCCTFVSGLRKQPDGPGRFPVKNKEMNFDKEINRIAANLGMVPGTVKTFEFDGRKVNAVDIFGGHKPENAIWIEYLTIDAVVLKEGKSGNTQLRMQGYVKYSNRENAMYRVIVPWEIDPSDLSKILETISK